MEYKEYLKSSDWIKLRRLKFKKKDRKCAICCSSENLDVHHLIYYSNLGDTETKDLRVLCRKCHSFTHFLFKKGLIKFSKETRKNRFSEIKRGMTKYYGLKRYTPLFNLWENYEYKKEYEFFKIKSRKRQILEFII